MNHYLKQTTMEQLTIKHLGRRLAYGLKINIGTTPNHYPLEMTAQDEMNSNSISITDTLENDHKPILRDLSDLTKEITHNGEKFEPFDYFYDDPERDWFAGNVFMNYLFEGNIDKTDFNFIPYYVIEKLLEWQFRIDEPEGTWIDVNTLPKNPYE